MESSTTHSRYPPRDRLGRKQPRRFTLLSLMGTQVFRQMIESFDQIVPDEFWALDADEDDEPMVVVACPCGDEPRVRQFCTGGCGCGRSYMFTGKEVRVFRPEGVEASVPDRPTS